MRTTPFRFSKRNIVMNQGNTLACRLVIDLRTRKHGGGQSFPKNRWYFWNFTSVFFDIFLGTQKLRFRRDPSPEPPPPLWSSLHRNEKRNGIEERCIGFRFCYSLIIFSVVAFWSVFFFFSLSFFVVFLSFSFLLVFNFIDFQEFFSLYDRGERNGGLDFH